MKTIALTLGLLFVVSVNTGFSQLLRKDVYDFSVGDIYSIRYKWHQGSNNFTGNVRYIMCRILEKEYNSDSSQVSYFAQRQTYIPPLPLGNGTGSAPEFHIDSVTFSYTQLLMDYRTDYNEFGFGSAGPLMLNNYGFTCTILDSSYTVGYCNSFNNNRFNFGIVINNPDSCSVEVPISHYYVGEKIGGPYGEWHYAGGADPTANYWGTFLDYYYKDGEACGVFPEYFLGIEEYEVKQFKVYPVPASEILHIDGDVKIERIELIDLTNKVLLKTDNLTDKRIDINSLPSGVYLLRVFKGAGKYENHRVVKL
ncbi:Beta-agarase D precursor [compost metagenome]